MICPTERPIRIAGASGSVSDRRFALASFASRYETDPIDVIICDYMSEGTMAPAAVRKKRNAASSSSDAVPTNLLDPTGPAFEMTFLEAIEPALVDLAKYGIRVAVNAGGSEPGKCANYLKRMIQEKGVDIPIAWIDGDDVLHAIEEDLSNGKNPFNNIHTGRGFLDWKSEFEPLGAQAYLGGLGIAEAFKLGAQIVICPRVSDASPVIGAAYWWHEWHRDMLPELANALVAGHLLECSTYVTGGNYSGFKELENVGENGWADLGFPIGEISKDGSLIMTKQKGTGGVVNVHTCSSQMLYEIQGAWYFNSDVTAVLNEIWFEQLQPDRVALCGVRALPPPPTTKVGVTALGGYQAESLWFFTGLDLAAKARMLESQLRRALSPYSSKYTLLKFHVIGAPPANADRQDAATACFRIFAQAKTEEDLALAKFLRPIADNIMQCYPGGTYHLDVRQGIPKPFYEYYVTLVPQALVRQVVHIASKELPIAPPSITHTFPERQLSEPSSLAPAHNLEELGETQNLPLGTIVYARSGDKGSDCNCGLWVRREDEYTWLRHLLSIDNIKVLLGKEYTPSVQIERFELPNLKGVHFLFRNLLDRGVTSTASLDFLGKNVAEFLRQRTVDIPKRFLDRGETLI